MVLWRRGAEGHSAFGRAASKMLLLFRVPVDCLSGLCHLNQDKGNSNRLLYCWLSVNLPVQGLEWLSLVLTGVLFFFTRQKLRHQLSVSLTASRALMRPPPLTKTLQISCGIENGPLAAGLLELNVEKRWNETSKQHFSFPLCTKLTANQLCRC